MGSQLYIKNNEEAINIYPKGFIGDIKDFSTGKNLENILRQFNMYYLNYDGDEVNTRLQVDPKLRRRGLSIAYILDDGTSVFQYYNSDNIDNESWADASNWRDIGLHLIDDEYGYSDSRLLSQKFITENIRDKVVIMTQAEYDALPTKEDKLYLVIEE